MIYKMRSPGFSSRRPSSVVRFAGVSFLLIIYFFLFEPSSHRDPYLKIYSSPPRQASRLQSNTLAPNPDKGHQQPISTQPSPGNPRNHPIDKLIRDAENDYQLMMSQESRSLEEAAAEYRKRRGRHPPPGFDVWHRFAVKNQAIIVEDFWDQIYHDLGPFWAVPPVQIRKEAWDFEMTINVRNGIASAKSDWFWTQIWLDMIQHIEGMLPDMDIALNAMDEPRLVVPWEDVSKLVSEAQKTVKLVEPNEVEGTYEILPDPGEGKDRTSIGQPKNWEKTQPTPPPPPEPYWAIARRGCPPDSEARKWPVMTDFDHAPQIASDNALPHMYQGFVSNYKLATSICRQPDLEGIFMEPLSVSSTKTLFPVFGGSKLSINNEVLLPAPMYWTGEERFTAGGIVGRPWSDKQSRAMWRGVATGGRARATNWKGFQRHRFLAMNNSTKLRAAEESTSEPVNFALPERKYELKAQAEGRLGNWTESWTNMSFTDLNCQPPEANGQCRYTSPHYEVTEGVTLYDMFNYKYLPDVDGNSFSGRYLGFLRSTSLPIKAAIFREWHDDRLVAWKHFVPMDVRFGDWHGIMEYFLGYKDAKGRQAAPDHDDAAERIAMAGKEWAERVLRREDMLIYVLRLLLEYGRVSDERRENMGFVDDLLPTTEP